MKEGLTCSSKNNSANKLSKISYLVVVVVLIRTRALLRDRNISTFQHIMFLLEFLVNASRLAAVLSYCGYGRRGEANEKHSHKEILTVNTNARGVKPSKLFFSG